MAMRSLCCFSSGEGLANSRYRHSSPMYCITVHLYSLMSDQNFVLLNLQQHVEPTFTAGLRA